MIKLNIEGLINTNANSIEAKFQSVNEYYWSISDFRILFTDLGLTSFTELAKSIFASDNETHINVVTKICKMFDISGSLDFKDWQYNGIPFGEHLLIIRESIPEKDRLC
jgi:hypothetical protein